MKIGPRDNKWNVLDLFSGIGGFGLGLEAAGMKTVAFCEIDPDCRAVLTRKWPHTPIFPDIRCLGPINLTEQNIPDIDVICGGFPCQDISFAGKGAGIDGARSGLWAEYARIIGALRPRYVIVENVAALLRRGLDRVLGDLAALGYDAEWHCIPASAIGAPHRRDRIWIIAYPNGTRRKRLVESVDLGKIGQGRWGGQKNMQAIDPFQRGDLWPQPLLRRMDDGTHRRVHRLRMIGNSVVPDIPHLLGLAIMGAHNNENRAA